MLASAPLFVRSRRALGLGFVMAVSFVGCWRLPVELVNVPFSYQRGLVMVHLVPLLACLAWPFMAYSPMPEMERAVPKKPMVFLRLGWWLITAALIALTGALAYAIRGASGWFVVSHVRNALLGMAIATVCCVILPQAAGWIPLVVAIATFWVAGTIDDAGTPHWWAIPFYLADSPIAAAISASLALAGLLLYIRFERGTSR